MRRIKGLWRRATCDSQNPWLPEYASIPGYTACEKPEFRWKAPRACNSHWQLSTDRRPVAAPKATLFIDSWRRGPARVRWRCPDAAFFL